MKVETTRTVMAVVMLVVIMAPGTVLAQLSREDIEALRERGKAEGWTFTVGESEATLRPLRDLCGAVEPPNWRANAVFDNRPARRDLPASYDWRDYSGCTSIRNQGTCGSCWAFAAIGPVESALLINESLNTDLSEQWLVSCTDAGNCSGGWHSVALDYLKLGGLQDPHGDSGAVLEVDFPYAAADIACGGPYSHPHSIFSWAAVGTVESNADIEQIKQAILDYGPVSTCVRVNAPFQAYTGDVFNACEEGAINHAVVLVGWDDALGTDGVWITRNSWGTNWGISGYMLIEYGCSNIEYGTCYVNYNPQDCNGNAIPDRCDISCETPGGPCDIPGCGAVADCNVNKIPDDCDISSGMSTDYNNNGILDDCELDCNDNGVPDECDLSCDGGCSGAPGCGLSTDCDNSNVPDECKADCQPNGVPDACDIIALTSDDCQPDNVPDECQLEETVAVGVGPSCSLTANNGDPWCDDLESYAPGSIHGLNMWEGWQNNPDHAGAVTTEQNHTPGGSQSLHVGDGGSEDTYRVLQGYDLDTWPYWSVRGWTLIPSLTAGTSYFVANSDYDRTISGTKPGVKLRAEPVEGWLYNDLTGARLPLIINEWAEVYILVDLARDLATIYYDGKLLDTHAWTLGGGSLQIAAAHAIGFGPEGIYVDDLSVTPTRWFSRDCNGNEIPDDCDIADDPGADVNGNGIPDECETPMPERPALPSGEAACDKSRYISFVPGNPGAQTALRVTLLSLPPQFAEYKGTHVWVGEPVEICENSGQKEPPPGGCGPAWVGGPVLTMNCANLQATAYCHDFGSLDSLNVTDCEVVPGATYYVQAVDCATNLDEEANYSAPLVVNTSSWGNICGVYDVGNSRWGEPDTSIDIVYDVTACIDKFKNVAYAPLKSRADIDPNVPDGKINITSDVTKIIDAFGGDPYPFAGPGTCPP